MNNYYCLKCKLDFKWESPNGKHKIGKCPKCGKKAKLMGTESFYTHGTNLPK